MRKTLQQVFLASALLSCLISCIDKDVYQGNGDDNQGAEHTRYVSYLYPYGSEAQNVVAEITLEIDGEINTDMIKAEMPFLKYNKSWLFMLTQDDCMHAAYSTTWAAINGKPLSPDPKYYYNAEQLAAGDLPPDVFYLNKTLGSTDGTGNEVRFAFTTTLSAEEDWMDAEIIVNKGFTDNYYRFHMKSGLTWNNVTEMLSYGTGIAFHDVKTEAVNNEDSILKHYELSQQIVLDKLDGRGCKTLAEPNGNKTYVRAALDYAPIQIMTAQGAGASDPELVHLQPFKVNSDLHERLIQRYIYESPFDIITPIETELRKDEEERYAIHVGIHGTGYTFAQFLLWLNNEYGKDGDDSVWFPSLEEYYEYAYYRSHGTIEQEVEGNRITLKISLPSEQYFYYPSITLNLSGIKEAQVKSITSGDEVTGLSYGNHADGLMLNIDCRRFLVEHAEHFVDKYLESPTESNKRDAVYFVKKLKESPVKEELSKKIPGYK
jgi:hypothetical protein